VESQDQGASMTFRENLGDKSAVEKEKKAETDSATEAAVALLSGRSILAELVQTALGGYGRYIQDHHGVVMSGLERITTS
jgi:hypothetical protein